MDFIKQFSDNSIDGILYDPPYSPRQVSECYKEFGKKVTSEMTRSTFWSMQKVEISRILKRLGVAITFG
ncbi:hypothetical protein [Fusobacterium nucleatum]|uniref:hypothetical protein n=1 Tax=Fusobacterium nucleatum TaxID=851 RepID=UPI001C9D383A|nr:hypothetical protein [Fusobacterium nucleatum]